MAKDTQLVLTGEELRLVAELVVDRLKGEDPPAREDAPRLWRLAVRLDQRVGSKVGFLDDWDWDLPQWIREILHRTFTPQPGKSKRRAPEAPARAARKPGARAPEPKVRPFPEAAERAIDDAFPDLQRAATAPLSGSAARRRGGLLRAAQAAEVKGDKAGAAQYRKRAEQLGRAAAAPRVDS